MKQSHFYVAARQQMLVVGFGRRAVVKRKAEWGGPVIRLLIKGEERNPCKTKNKTKNFVAVYPKN